MQDTVRALARDGKAPPQPVFMPLVFSAAARVAGLSPRQFFSNPTKIANGLRQLQGPLHCDALACYADQTLIAEALGATLDWEAGPPRVAAPPAELTPLGDIAERGRVPVMLEVVHRLRVVLRGRVALAVALPGPLSTVGHLSMSSTAGAVPAGAENLAAAGDATLQAARAACQAGADLILLIETQLPAADSEPGSQWQDTVGTICNIIRFHEAVPVLLELQPANVSWQRLAAPGALPCLPAAFLNGLPDSGAQPDIPFGVALEATPPPVAAVPLFQNLNCALITTAGNLPYEIEARELRSLVAGLRRAIAKTS